MVLWPFSFSTGGKTREVQISPVSVVGLGWFCKPPVELVSDVSRETTQKKKSSKISQQGTGVQKQEKNPRSHSQAAPPRDRDASRVLSEIHFFSSEMKAASYSSLSNRKGFRVSGREVERSPHQEKRRSGGMVLSSSRLPTECVRTNTSRFSPAAVGRPPTSSREGPRRTTTLGYPQAKASPARKNTTD